MREKWHAFRLRLKALLVRRRMDRDMAEELAFHQAMLREKAVRNGATEQEASTAARRAFGNPSRWHERLRELWQFQPLENMLRDLNFSLRMLAKSPGFTLVAVATLALGFGANMAIFSLINALLLRPLPVPHSEQLVVVALDQHVSRGPQYAFGVPYVRELEKQSDLFSGIFGFSTDPRLQIQGSSGRESSVGQFVSGRFFTTLATPPLMGRVLGPEDDRTGGNPAGLTVVISERFWHRWFAGSNQVLGRKLTVNNSVFTVVGVMPDKFFGADPTFHPEFFLPLASESILKGSTSMTGFGNHAWWLTAVGRLRPGITLEAANAALSPRTLPLLKDAGVDTGMMQDAQKQHYAFAAEPGARGYTFIRSAFRKPLVAVFVMCGGILLLACLNLASLLLARSASRTQELATRLALGASRMQLLRQLLIESFLIAVLGVAVSLTTAPLIGRSLAAMLFGNEMPMVALDTSLDGRVLAFGAISAIVASVLIGLAPASRATSGSLQQGLRQGRTLQPGERRRVVPRLMLTLEVSLAVILLVCAGLLTSSLVRLYRVGAGFDPRGVINIAFDMDGSRLRGPELTSFYQQVGEILGQQPGVTDVSFQRIIPLSGSGWNGWLSAPGGKGVDANMNLVAADYFRTLRIPLLRGRDFQWSDNLSTSNKIILNKEAAKELFDSKDAIGRTVIQSEHLKVTGTKSYEVIGVVEDSKYYELREATKPIVYYALPQNTDPIYSFFAVVRTSGPAGPLAAASRALAHRLAPEIPVPVMTTMDSVLDDSISSERMMAMLSVYFAACALLVTAIGLYGTLSYETTRRTSEIGIRMALGAQRAQVVRMVFQENAWVAATGAAAGLVLALLGARLLASFLYQTSGHDPWVIVVSVCALVGVACGASLAPAVKAALVDPMVAIRHE